MSEAVKAKGKISPEYWIDCGGCQESRCLCENFQYKARQTAREWGWVETRKFGWVCKSCYERIRTKRVSKESN